MATIRQIRRRIRSVASTAKITNAMQLVAASKMRRAQERALSARPYAEKLREVLVGIASAVGGESESLHPLLQSREPHRVGVIHVTPDRGLCGGLNANLNRAAASFLLEQSPLEVSTVTVGKKGRDFLRRVGATIDAEFTGLGDYPSLMEIVPIVRLATDGFLDGRYDRVYLLYADFVNTVTQRPTAVQLLPLAAPATAHTRRTVAYIYEPSPADVLSQMLPRYVELLVYQAILESAASEQSARMVAMKNATDNANDLVKSLTLVYNKVRQEQITKELLDIVGGVEGLSA